MAVSDKKQLILSLLSQYSQPLGLPEIRSHLINDAVINIPDRTLRRLLSALAEEGQVLKSGKKRGTKYLKPQGYKIASPDGQYTVPHLKFLDDVPKHRRALLLAHIRDLWTHSSTALEGNTLSLDDTHFLLEEGLTVAGKPIREHQEIIGHARAIELIYSRLLKPSHQLVDKEFIFQLHKAVQTERVTDIYKPNGAWKLEVNGTYARDENGHQVFIEFARPNAVETLMSELIFFINSVEHKSLKLINAPAYYAKVHIGFIQIHPFWDGNGVLARLLANLMLLKAGLPPLVIDQTQRKNYLDILNQYSLNIGQLTSLSGVWPNEIELKDFIRFCVNCYQQTKDLVTTASEI